MKNVDFYLDNFCTPRNTNYYFLRLCRTQFDFELLLEFSMDQFIECYYCYCTFCEYSGGRPALSFLYISRMNRYIYISPFLLAQPPLPTSSQLSTLPLFRQCAAAFTFFIIITIRFSFYFGHIYVIDSSNQDKRQQQNRIFCLWKA